jgi:hypothetical protein
LPVLPTYTAPTGLSEVAPPVCNKNTPLPCTYTPGIYKDLVKLNYTTNFTPGTYIFEDGLNTNGQTVTNSTTTSEAGITGVSFYIPANKTLDLSGHITLNAPAEAGCTAGSSVVISQPAGTLQNVTLNGNTGSLTLTGVANFPSMDLRLDGAASSLQINGTLVVNSMDLRGNIYPTAGASPCYSIPFGKRIILVQ